MSTLSGMSNLSQGKRAWQYSAFITGFVAFAMVFVVFWQATHPVTRLIPYGFDTAKGVVELRENGKHNLEYIALIALADVKLTADWTPNNVLVQFSRFENRLSPGYRNKQINHLISEANKYSESPFEQVFHPDSIKARSGKSIVIEGRIKRWNGAEQVVDQYVAYDIDYEYIGGVPYISRFIVEKKHTTDGITNDQENIS